VVPHPIPVETPVITTFFPYAVVSPMAASPSAQVLGVSVVAMFLSFVVSQWVVAAQMLACSGVGSGRRWVLLRLVRTSRLVAWCRGGRSARRRDCDIGRRICTAESDADLLDLRI
jgi:hypothetical protein